MIETVYKRDMLQVRKLGAEIGMWQIFQASNVLGRPIVSVFPDEEETQATGTILTELYSRGTKSIDVTSL